MNLLNEWFKDKHIFNIFSPPKKKMRTQESIDGIKIFILQQVSDSGIDFWFPTLVRSVKAPPPSELSGQKRSKVH